MLFPPVVNKTPDLLLYFSETWHISRSVISVITKHIFRAHIFRV